MRKMPATPWIAKHSQYKIACVYSSRLMDFSGAEKRSQRVVLNYDFISTSINTNS